MWSLLIFFFVLSIVVSFLCSIWEAVLLSINPSYINRVKQEGRSFSVDLVKFKEDIDRPLSAILTLNTIAHTTGAVGVGAQAGKLYGEADWQLFGIALNPESLIAAVMTLAILILSEIIPKTIGANSWRRLASFTVRSVKVLIFILAPFVWLSQRITKTLKKDKERSVYSRADFAAMAKASLEEGILEEKESKIISNLMRFQSIVVKNIMTPRSVMVTAPENLTTRAFFEQYQPFRFSRIPLFEGEMDNITGFVLKDEILSCLVNRQEEQTLRDLRKPIIAVRDDLALPALFDRLTRESNHMAIVMDEYGSLVGLVTMEDVFETLLGLEIVDETDTVVDLQALARQQWEERAKRGGRNKK